MNTRIQDNLECHTMCCDTIIEDTIHSTLEVLDYTVDSIQHSAFVTGLKICFKGKIHNITVKADLDDTIDMYEELSVRDMPTDLLLSLLADGYTFEEVCDIDFDWADITYIKAWSYEEAKREYFNEYLSEMVENFDTFKVYLDDGFYTDYLLDYNIMESKNFDTGYYFIRF